ncbi:MAG: TIGR03118 family protein [Smithella sp.]
MIVSYKTACRSKVVVLWLMVMLFLPILSSSALATQLFDEMNLVTNNQAAHSAQITDKNLVNAWGISYGPTTPFWVSDNGTGLTTLYNVNPSSNKTSIASLSVTIPGDGTPTGQVFNNNIGAFNSDRFLFVSEDGTISGWKSALGTKAETLKAGSSTNVYKGTTNATINGNSYLYSANFRAGKIDVLKGTTAAPNLTGTFTDPNLPAGYAPFNIQNLNGKLYVTYAKQDAQKHDDVAGVGNGIVNVFDTKGNFIKRVQTGGTLNSPWGLAIAPASFGEFAGDLLVGNFGDGRISVFDLNTNTFVGQLRSNNGNVLSIDGLWGLKVGNNGNAGSSNKLYFSAGPDGETNGLFGVIQSNSGKSSTKVPEPATMFLLSLGLIGLAAFRKRIQ